MNVSDTEKKHIQDRQSEKSSVFSLAAIFLVAVVIFHTVLTSPCVTVSYIQIHKRNTFFNEFTLDHPIIKNWNEVPLTLVRLKKWSNEDLWAKSWKSCNQLFHVIDEFIIIKFISSPNIILCPKWCQNQVDFGENGSLLERFAKIYSGNGFFMST